MTDHLDPKIIDASATKDFFVDMLVRDVALIPAINDLVDNCVDGARRTRSEQDYTGLTVRIEATPDHFKIADNTGGISVDLARHYAFRFGRPKGMPSIPHSVGQFGVGMKRALFKLGRAFRIESTTNVSRFVVEENVDNWKDKPEWQFQFKEREEKLTGVAPDDQGTVITVRPLHDGVSADFGLANFQTRLRDEIRQAHLDSMDKGLTITHNGLPLEVRPFELLHSAELKPAYREMTIGDPSDSHVQLKMYAGISVSTPSQAGWYVFCNGRLVLGADQSVTTGWGEGDGKTIPKYHNQYARFRGYTFFDSDDAGLLPWTTTKTNVDADSGTFRAVRLEMIKLMRPVIDFLNKLDAEKDLEETDEKPLEAIVNAASRAKLSVVLTRDTFVVPKPTPVPAPPRTGRIQYSKPIERIERAKKVLKVGTLREVGEETFEYFFERECEE